MLFQEGEVVGRGQEIIVAMRFAGESLFEGFYKIRVSIFSKGCHRLDGWLAGITIAGVVVLVCECGMIQWAGQQKLLTFHTYNDHPMCPPYNPCPTTVYQQLSPIISTAFPSFPITLSPLHPGYISYNPSSNHLPATPRPCLPHFISFITIILQIQSHSPHPKPPSPIPPASPIRNSTGLPPIQALKLLNLFLYYLFISEGMQKEMDKPFQKHHTPKQKMQASRYCRGIRDFLETYKTKKCAILYEHNEQLCPQFHSQMDKRRNPYSGHGFLYYPTSHCPCDQHKCSNYHSINERNFHPLTYKVQKCNNYYDCPYKLQCHGLHEEDEMHFQLGEAFRFDIALFKTRPCPRKEPHQRKVCLYYHNDKDKRRPNFQGYSHIPCNKPNCACGKSHNKIEQLYHPSRYKSKFCQTYGGDTMACEYRDFCSFAHTKEEITIDLIDETNKDPNYLVYNYKIIWCPYTLDHDRSSCPYAHNIQDYRRNPRDYKYLPEKCEAWCFTLKIESIEQGGCKAGMACGKCHGWMEQRYHPQVFLPKKPKGYLPREDMIEKKLNYSKKASKKGEKNIEAIAYKEIQAIKPAKFAVGAPFFKSDRDNSQTSKKTKAKTGNVCSEKSCNEDEKETRSKIEVGSKLEVGSQLEKPARPIGGLEEEIWHFEQAENKAETRSKSQGNSSDFVPSYSHTIKDVFGNENGLMDKLVKWKVNEVTLINADQKKIDKMSFLNSKQKEKLINKLKEYSLKKELRTVEYSHSLTRFFVRSNADAILQKLRNKKVSEPKILRLQSRQATKDFSFLTETEKEVLPRLLRKYQEEMEFGSLMNSVERFIGEPSPDPDFNNDN